MNHVDFAVTSPCCGSSLDEVTGSRESTVERLLVAACRCCHREYLLSVRISSTHLPKDLNGRKRG